MADSPVMKSRVSFMKDEAWKYISSQKKDFEDAFSSNAWLTTKKKKDFEKILRSGNELAGFQSVLMAGGRRAAMMWWMGRYLLYSRNDYKNGWGYIHGGLDAVWWGFACRPNTYMDLESNIQLLMAWFDVTGVPQRADYIGEYLSGQKGIPDREKYLEHSEIGKLLTQLWCKDRSINIDYLNGLYKFHKNEHNYVNIVDNIFTEDVDLFSSFLDSALQYRVGSSIKENGEFRTAIAFHLIPVEFYYIERIRRKRNLRTIFPSSDLFSSDVNFYPPSYQGLSMEADPVLYGAIKKAVEQKWLDSKMVEKMM